jgi:hypothetical protein
MLPAMAIDAPRGGPTAVYLEVGRRRVFAAAVNWPGWCRSGKGEELALEALAAAAPRYAVVVAQAGLPFPPGVADAFDVVERLAGSATTDFGAPGAVAGGDAEPLTREEAERHAALVAASWTVFDRIAGGAPVELRKGPRGGGRDRDAIVEHVLAAETSYARSLGIRLPQPAAGDAASGAALRSAIIGAVQAASEPTLRVGKGWPVRYAARRIAWHVLDHAWEIEDRSGPPPD